MDSGDKPHISYYVDTNEDLHARARATIIDEDEKESLSDNAKIKIEKIIQMYGLVANSYGSVHSGTVSGKISSDNPFGQPKFRPDALSLVPMPTKKQREDNVSILRKTVEKYELIRTIWENGRKRFLANAVDYYHRSLGDHDKEEKIIDLMICLESLFSGGSQELRLRYSLRIAHLLGINQQGNLPDIFRNVYALYDKRSKVVHGVENVELNDKDIRIFQEYLKEAIKLFIHIELSKKELLTLLDESVYDLEKREQLIQIVSDSIGKW